MGDWLDLVHAHRNQAYGGYRLRRLESRHTLVGLVLGMLMVSLAFAIPYGIYRWQEMQSGKLPVEQVRVVSYAQLAPPPPIERNEPPPQIQPAAPKATVKFRPPVVKPDEEVVEEEPMPTVEELAAIDPGLAATPGDSVILTEPLAVVETPVEEEPPPKPAPPKPFVVVEQMPAFPGGIESLYAYLKDHIRYPQVAMENGISGKVFVKFVVQSDGTVTDVHVVRGIGGGCDEEAVRVVRAMPKWEPGRQNKRAVPVEYTLPIHFLLKN